MIGKKFDIYTVLEKRGEGGMGVFYKARDERLDRNVGLKTLHPDLVSDPEFREKLEREAKSLARLNHNNIVTIYQYLIAEGHHFIVMEYVEGRTVAETIADWGPYSFADAAKIVLQILDAIGYAHKHQVIHRDIKPSNILINAEGTAKVTDFGIAKLVDSAHKTRTGQGAGSLYYMSPEQIQHGTIDGRADIYSLGITFYEMITGTVPFAAESEFGIMKKHLEEQPQPPSHFNPEITKVQNELILHAMAKAPGERFADAKDFAEAIHDALSLGDTTSPGTKPKVKPITDKKPPASVKETSVEPPGPGPQHREQRPQAYARKTSFKPGWIVYPLLVAAAAVIGYMVFSPRPEPELPPIIVEQDADTGSDSALTKNEDTMVTPLRDTQTIIAEIPEKPVDTQQVVIHEPHSEPPPPAAVLTINATPLNRRAEITGIWLDGRRVASAAPYTISRLDRGLHWIKVESTFGTWTDTVTWAGNDRDLDFFLTENSSGRINIAAVFPDGENNADIFIDDVDIGFWTPHSKPGLPAGPHKIEVRKDGYQAVGGPRLVRLETGEKATVRFEMRQR